MDENTGARVRFPPPLVFVVCILVGIGLKQVQPFPTYLPRTLSLVAGYALVAAALGLLASAQLLFRRAGQNPIPWKPTPSLEFSGPYRFTRNPMYVGMTLLQMGLGLLLDNLWILVLAGPALAVVHVIAVLPEEAYLSGKFGEPYRHYLAKVRRYL